MYIICKNDTIIADIWIANNAIIKLWCHGATIVVEMINSTDTRNDWGQLWGLIYCHWHFEPHFILKPCIHTFYQISIAYDWCRDNSWRIVTWRYMTHFFSLRHIFLPLAPAGELALDSAQANFTTNTINYSNEGLWMDQRIYIIAQNEGLWKTKESMLLGGTNHINFNFLRSVLSNAIKTCVDHCNQWFL